MSAPQPLKKPNGVPPSEPTALRRMQSTMRLESDAIVSAADRLTDQCEPLIALLNDCEGRILLTGVGKTGFIARKAAATLCSTGAPAIFLHPAEALHGDLGIVTQQDVLIAISHSGETEEVLKVIEYMQRNGVPVIALTGNLHSTLACHSQFAIDCQVEREADAMSLAPTCSTAVMLAVTDAIAMELMHQKGFTAESFAQFHPGGTLGKRLLLKISDVMRTGDAIPLAPQQSELRRAIETISEKQMGCVLLVDDARQLTGVLTDGDLRRTLQTIHTANVDTMSQPAADVMTRAPLTIDSHHLAAEGLHLMEERSITVLPVVDDNQIVGIVHLHDLIKAGLA